MFIDLYCVFIVSESVFPSGGQAVRRSGGQSVSRSVGQSVSRSVGPPRISYQGFFPASIRLLLMIPIPIFRNPADRMRMPVHSNARTLHAAATLHPMVSAHHTPKSMYCAFKCRFTRAGSSAFARQRCSSGVGSLGVCCIGFMVVLFCFIVLSPPCSALSRRRGLSCSRRGFYSSNLGFRISE